MSEYAIGFDIGSSSVKASIVNLGTREIMGTTHYPQTEMEVISRQTGWPNSSRKFGGKTYV